MKRILSYVALGLCAFLVFAVVELPADRVYSWIKPSLGGAVLYDVKGTFWRGKAAAAKVNGKLYRAVQWSVAPWTIVLGRLDANVRFDNGDSWAHGRVGITAGKQLRFTDVTAQMSAAEVRPMFPRIVLDFAGTFVLKLADAEFDPQANKLTGVSGELTWLDAMLGSANGMALGTFKLALTSAADGITGKLADDGKGPLSAEGTLLLKPDNTYQLTGSLATRDASRSDLVLALRGIGQPDSEGRVKISYNGAL